MNFIDYMFAWYYNHKGGNTNESIFGSSFALGLVLGQNLFIISVYLLISLDIMPCNQLLYLLLVPGILSYLYFKFNYKRALENYAKLGKSPRRTSFTWSYIILTWILFLLSMFSLINYNNRLDDRLIDKEKTTESAFIYSINSIKNENHSFLYRFWYNGSEYSFDKKYDPDKQKIIPGDSCIVEFAASDPTLHRLAKNKDGSIKIKRKYYNK